MEGKGFEPTVEALFGANGFFDDTIFKALFWAEDKVNPSIRELVYKWFSLPQGPRPVSTAANPGLCLEQGHFDKTF